MKLSPELFSIDIGITSRLQTNTNPWSLTNLKVSKIESHDDYPPKNDIALIKLRVIFIFIIFKIK